MKCPKCEYLGFESGDKCENCGYEFSLAFPPTEASVLDLPLAQAPNDLLNPDSDLPEIRQSFDLDRIITAELGDLPLFQPASAGTSGNPPPIVKVPKDDAPMIVTPSKPRTPLGVRRATPEIQRARVHTPRVEESLFEEPPATPATTFVERSGVVADHGGLAAPSSRVIAALVDGAILFAVDSAVLYFTLRLCNLTPGEILELPLIPLFAFLLLLNGGYFVAFTAVGGQSIGKMALGIKVVGDQDRPVPVGRATLRTIAYFVSALPLGAGFIPGVFGTERLALHDRLAHTRVVRPSSL